MAAKKKPVRNELNLVYRKVSELVPYERNAKIHEDYDIDVIAENIKRLKFKVPFVIDSNNVIVCGHGRRLALIKLGREDEEFPCVLADDLSPQELELMRISENNSSEKAGYDYEIFDSILAGLKDSDFDLPALGFDNFDDVSDADEEEAEEPVVDVDCDTGTETTTCDTPEDKKTIVCPHCGKSFEV